MKSNPERYKNLRHKCPRCLRTGDVFNRGFIVVTAEAWEKVFCEVCWNEALINMLSEVVPEAEELKTVRIYDA